MTMIEKVARAINEEISMQRIDPFSSAKFSGVIPPIDWDRVARAAIGAMRDPTDKMICNGLDAWDRGNRSYTQQWKAMIDGALNEEPT